MIIYKTTNAINGKIYIGQWNGICKSYKGGGRIFKRAVKKYGTQNFKLEIIIEGDFNQELTDQLEIHYIQLYNARNPKIGYNVSPGGSSSGKHSEETKKKIGDANRGRKATKETIEILSKSHLGLKPTQEQVRKRTEKLYKKTILCNKQGEPIKEFKSREECANYIGCHKGTIGNVMRGTYSDVGGYTFKNG